MSKRKNGEGSYGERTINGSKYKYYKDPSGHFTYAKTSTELKEKLKKKELERKENPKPKYIDESHILFSDYCYEWLTKKKKPEIGEKRFDWYEDSIKSRIAPTTLGKTEIGSINLLMINSFLSDMKEKYSKGTINSTGYIIKQVVRYGIDNGYIGDIDFNNIKFPKEDQVAIKKKDVPFISLGDMEKVYQESLNPKYGDGVKVLVFIMYTGLRVSEAIALKWKNVDKNFKWIKVVESAVEVVKRDKNGNAILNSDGKKVHVVKIKSPKTESGIRTIPLTERATEVLKYFSEKYGRNEDNFVFLNSGGNLFDRVKLDECLKRLIKNAGCSRKDYSVHSLRHGFGSVLISKGVDIKVVSRLLGHKDITTTYNIYIGVYKEDEIAAIKKAFEE